MKKIAVICTLYGPNGGTGRVTTELFERYACDGNEVHVYCAEVDQTFAKTSGVTSITELKATNIGILRQLHFLIKATRSVRKKDYDIVYCTGDYYLKPDIVTIHTLKKYGRKVIEQLEKSKILKREQSFIKAIARRIYCPLLFEIGEQLVYRRRDTMFIGVSNGVMKEFCREFRQKDSRRIYVIPNGVDTEKNRYSKEKRRKIREELHLQDGNKVLLFVGSDWNHKRLEIALKLCARHADTHLVVAGHDNWSFFASMAERLECSERVHFIGFKKNIEDYYSAGDYFIFPSAYETFGLVVIEAMAAGMIVISNKLNGVEDFVHTGVNGFLTDNESLDAFDEKLTFILNHPEMEEQIRRNAVETAHTYSWENSYQQYKKIFDNYIRRK